MFVPESYGFCGIEQVCCYAMQRKREIEADALLRYALWHHAGSFSLFMYQESKLLSDVENRFYCCQAFLILSCQCWDIPELKQTFWDCRAIFYTHVPLLCGYCTCHGAAWQHRACMSQSVQCLHCNVLDLGAGAGNRGTWGGLPVHEGSLAISHSHHLW